MDQISSSTLGRILADSPTTLGRFLEGNPDDCRCAIHTKIECGLPGSPGCKAKQPGSAPSIAALYRDKFGSGFCHALPAVRRADAEFARGVLEVEGDYLQGVRSERFDRLFTGKFEAPSAFGAGYCYMLLIRADARWRVARLLGPGPLVVDLLRVLPYAATHTSGWFQLEENDVGFHVVKDKDRKGSAFLAVREVYRKLALALFHRGADLKIGFDEGVVDVFATGMRAKLYELGIVVPDEFAGDVGVVCRSAATMPVSIRGGKERLRKLAYLGDRAMKLVFAVGSLELGTMEACSVEESHSQSDANFAALFVASGFSDCVSFGAGVNPSSAKVGGTALEAIAGLVWLSSGHAGLVKFMQFVGVPVRVSSDGL